jgi:hypothetical protein
MQDEQNEHVPNRVPNLTSFLTPFPNIGGQSAVPRAPRGIPGAQMVSVHFFASGTCSMDVHAFSLGFLFLAFYSGMDDLVDQAENLSFE